MKEPGSKTHSLKFKVPIFGDGGVGKTTLTHRFLNGLFRDTYHLTIGMDFFLKKLKIDGKNISLQIWDFAGEEKFRFLLPGAVMGANGTIFMYDITRYVTFKNLTEWLTVFNEANEIHDQKLFPILLVGSKLDLDGVRTVPKEEAIEFAHNNNFIDYIECSSKSGKNVEELFTILSRRMAKKYK